MPTNVKKVFGKERNLGDVFYNAENKTTFMTINLGTFGKQNFDLRKNEDGSFQITKNIFNKTENSKKEINFGRLFPAKTKEGQIVDGIYNGNLGLFSEYDKEIQKNIVSNNDSLRISVLSLKDKKQLGDSKILKIAFIKGYFAIEENENSNQQDELKNEFSTSENSEESQINYEEIPF